ncbi:unnamed protein product [Coffea canephora]|uniref:Uncharacterized protein n=1 Tax=Coffea canephora TaxID=49390 RepID=A0A068TLN5_COFCA|nr:unnamed protein product [Coffea canephora]
MVIQRLELCIELLNLVIEFVVVFINAVGMVVDQTTSLHLFASNPAYTVPAPYVGLLP